MDTTPSPERQPGARQAKADDTRFRLFTAGAELFATHGYHATSVEQIAKHAGVAKGTFFIHFPTKDAIVVEMVRLQTRLVTSERERLFVTESVGPLARLRATVMALGRLSDPNISRAVLTACCDRRDVGTAIDLLFQEILDGMTEDARAAVAAGELVLGTDPDELALLLMDAFLGATVSLASNPRGRSLTAILAKHVDTNVEAFGPRKVRKAGKSVGK